MTWPKQMNQKCKKILLYFLASAIVLVVCIIIAVTTIYNQLSYYSSQIQNNMSIQDVKQILDGRFVESDVTIKQIEDDGWSIGHLVSNEQELYARKYSYRLCKSLYFYVVYDSNDKKQLVIEAFE